jgi:hypothetical protein
MRSPGSEDKLARLLQATLNARLSGQEPPKITWKRIKLELETDNESWPCDGRDLADARSSVI